MHSGSFSPCIGIDLGTTYSCVGIYNDGKVDIIVNDQGSRTTPSFVSFIDNDEIQVGEPAKTLMATHPSNTIFDIKRLIGRKFTDPVVQKDLNYYPFKVEDNGENNPVISVNSKKFSPEQISALILNKLKQDAEKHANVEIKNAVITVPAYFNDSQRQATKDAGTLAGLNILRIINEPTAAALAYGLDKLGSRNVLVFDYGGGTMDTSILNIEDGNFQVKSTSGNSHLGGEDLDNILVEYCLIEFAKKNKLQHTKIKELLETSKVKSKLKKEVEIAKKVLSSANQTTVNIDNLFDGYDLSVTITRAKFEYLCDNEFKKCFEPINNALSDANMKKDDISDIVLVGGSTRIPKIRQMLKDYFNKEPKTEINPDEAVAHGAAIQAAILSGIQDSVTHDIVLVDVAPLSLGIETAGGVMSVIIKRNSTIPCEKIKFFSTYSENQPSVSIKIFEGERLLAKDNNLLSTFELLGIPPAPRGIPKICVKFLIDANGILNVSAYEESSGVHKSLTITSKNKLPKEKLELMYADAEKFLDTDKKVKRRIKVYNNFEYYINNIKNSVMTSEFKNIVGFDTFKQLNNLVVQYCQWLTENKFALEEEIVQKHQNAEEQIQPIIIQFLK